MGGPPLQMKTAGFACVHRYPMRQKSTHACLQGPHSGRLFSACTYAQIFGYHMVAMISHHAAHIQPNSCCQCLQACSVTILCELWQCCWHKSESQVLCRHLQQKGKLPCKCECCKKASTRFAGYQVLWGTQSAEQLDRQQNATGTT